MDCPSIHRVSAALQSGAVTGQLQVALPINLPKGAYANVLHKLPESRACHA